MPTYVDNFKVYKVLFSIFSGRLYRWCWWRLYWCLL